MTCLRNPLLLLLLLASLSWSCEKPTDISAVTGGGDLVIISNFSPDQSLNVVVTVTRSPLDGALQQEYVTDATVELFGEEGEFLEELTLSEQKNEEGAIPFYTTQDFVPQPQVAYTIVVDAPVHGTATAKSRIPEPIDLLSSRIKNFSRQVSETGTTNLQYEVNVSFQDPGKKQNYYHISLMQELFHYALSEEGDTLVGYSSYRPLVFDPADNTQTQIAHIGGGMLLDDGAFNGKIISYDLPVSFDYDATRYLHGQLILELRAVSEEYFYYFSSLSRQSGSKGQPFDDPVIIQDNVEGGRGVFAGFSSSVDSLAFSH